MTRVLVVGATGIIGGGLMQHLARREDLAVVGVSRSGGMAASGERTLAVDLLDPADCTAKLGAMSDVAHIFYAAYQWQPDRADEVAPNVAMLANVEKDIASENEASKLKIEVFYAEEDNMIGIAAGPRWLDDCWRPEQRGDEIQYNSRFVDGTDHNNILNIEFGIMEHIFENIPRHGP